MDKYQVAYEGQIIVKEPCTLPEATQIAADENRDAVSRGHVPAAEPVLAKS
jgi:hypothetical protein